MSALAWKAAPSFWAGIAEPPRSRPGAAEGSTDQKADCSLGAPSAGDGDPHAAVGRVEIVIETDQGERRAALKPGETFSSEGDLATAARKGEPAGGGS